MAAPLKFDLKRQIFIIIALCACAWSIAESLVDSYEREQAQLESEFYSQQLVAIRSNVEAAIFREIFLADSLATLVSIETDFAVNNFDSIAARLVANTRFIRNIGIAPNNEITKVFPLKGNEKAIGFRFESSPEQYRTVQFAMQKKQVVIAGPLTLVQGGTGLIARFPIFVDEARKEEYWGTVSIVFNFDLLYETLILPYEDELDISIIGKDGLGDKGEVFIGDEESYRSSESYMRVNLPYGDWVIGVQRTAQAENNAFFNISNAIRTTVYALFTLVYILILAFFNSYKKAQKLALQDDLTGLANRRHLMSNLNELCNKRRNASRFTLVNIDLNDFKEVNDTYSHAAGDELLIHVGNEIKDYLRGSDMVARVGGDEFIIILHRLVSEDEIKAKLQGLRQHLLDTPLQFNEHQIAASISYGYAIAKGSNIDVDKILSNADHNMYAFKAELKGAK